MQQLRDIKETPEEQKLNSRFFTDAVLPFFDAVAGWNSPAAGKLEERRGISLRGSASCPSDKVPDRYGVLRRRYKRWDRSVLEILQDYDRKISLLPAISEFLCGDDFHSRKLSPRACCDIAAQMPNVHTLECNLSDNERSDLARRIKMLQGFAAGLQAIPDSVRHFTLYHGPRAPDTHTWDPLAYIVAMKVHMIHSVSHFVACRGDCILSPSITLRLDKYGDFPYLEKVVVRLNEVTPSGEWFFTGHHTPAGEESGESDDSNIYIKPDTHSWFSACSTTHAAQHMPRLKEFFLEWMATPLPCGLEYKISNDGGPRAMLTLWGSPPAEPSLELKEAWGKVAEILVGSPDMMEVELQDEGRVIESM
ncbi:hypothetical protein AB5N19_02288 [Seiridium cardinale]